MIESLIIALCLVLSALLAGAEMAVVSVSRPWIREAARQGGSTSAHATRNL